MFAPTQQENSFTARNGGPAWPEDSYLSPFVQRRKTAHPVWPRAPKKTCQVRVWERDYNHI